MNEAAPTGDGLRSLRINNFDLIRLLAASQVVIMHLVHYFKIDVPEGIPHVLFIAFLNFPGVPIFFVISGYLVSLSWERSGSAAIYTANRCLRIFPALWACLIVTILMLLVSGYLASVQVPAGDLIRWIVLQATIGQLDNPGFLHGYGVGMPNGSLWSIPVEMQFYVVLPLLYVILPKSRRGFLIGLIVLTVGLAIASEVMVTTLDPTTKWGFRLLLGTFVPYVYMFLIGVLIQRLLPVLMPVLRGCFGIWLGLYLLVVFGLHYLGEMPTGDRLGTNNPPILISAILGMATISAAYTLPTLSGRLLRGNDISYGTYIYHMVYINLVLQLAVESLPWKIIIVVGGTYLSALLSWRFVERPAISLKRRTLRSAGTASKQATT